MIITGRYAALAPENRNHNATGKMMSVDRYALQRASARSMTDFDGGAGFAAGVAAVATARESGRNAWAIQTNNTPTNVPKLTPLITPKTASILTVPIAALTAMPTVAKVPISLDPPFAVK